MTPIPDLIIGCVEHRNEAARAEFQQRFGRILAAAIVRTLGSGSGGGRERAEDLLHDAYVRIYDRDHSPLRLLKTADERSLAGLLHAVGRSTVIDDWRKRQRERSNVSVEDLPPYASPGTDDRAGLVLNLTIRQIESMVRELSAKSNRPQDPDIFHLYYREGLRAREIAEREEFGLTEKGVESVIHRLTTEIRKRICQKDEGKSRAAASGLRR